MHHTIHIGAWAIFWFVVFILGLAAFFVYLTRPPKPETKVIYRDRPVGMNPALGAGYDPATVRPPLPVYPPGHAYAGMPYWPPGSPYYDPYYRNDGLVEGMLLGEMMAGGNRTEVIVERDGGYGGGGSYQPDAGSSDGGISYDSGPSDSNFDSGSSDSSGIDISWDD